MINQIIADINKALDNEAYLSALTLVLTIPDICGKAKYPKEKSGKKRYLLWYDEFVGTYEKPSIDIHDIQFPYLSGEVIYSLRNMMLHQGTPNIEKEKIEEECNRIDHFIIRIEKKKEFNLYVDAAHIYDDFSNNNRIEYAVNVRRLCMIITLSAKNYYKENMEKFNFFNYHIQDYNKEIEKVNRLNAKKK